MVVANGSGTNVGISEGGSGVCDTPNPMICPSIQNNLTSCFLSFFLILSICPISSFCLFSSVSSILSSFSLYWPKKISFSENRAFSIPNLRLFYWSWWSCFHLLHVSVLLCGVRLFLYIGICGAHCFFIGICDGLISNFWTDAMQIHYLVLLEQRCH